MNMSIDQAVALNEAARPLIKLLETVYHPHCMVIVTSTKVELLEMVRANPALGILEPVEPKPFGASYPWEIAPSWAQGAATDPDGRAYWHEFLSEPSAYKCGWDRYRGLTQEVNQPYTGEVCAGWRQSWGRRPEPLPQEDDREMPALPANLTTTAMDTILLGAPCPVVWATQSRLDNLSSYNATLPTHVRPGLLWKRGVTTTGSGPVWYLGEGIADADPKMVGIRWSRLRLLE